MTVTLKAAAAMTLVERVNHSRSFSPKRLRTAWENC